MAGSRFTRAWLVVIVGCGGMGPQPRPAPVDDGAPPREIRGELRAGDDTCPNLCDRYRFTWATPAQVEVRAETQLGDDTVTTVFLKAEGGGVDESGEFGSSSALGFTAQPGVEYTITVDAYNSYDAGPYALTISPPPQVEILAPERPVPQPPTPEEVEPDDTLPAKIAAVTEGWKLAKTVRGDLAKVPALKWPAKRGKCYQAVMVLEAGARKSGDWLWVMFKLDSSAESNHTTGGFLTGSQRVIHAGGEDMCPMHNGTVKLELVRHDTEEALADAGAGPFRVELYEQAISTRTLDQRARDDDDDYCRSCVQQEAACRQSGDTGPYSSCSKQFSACLYNGGMTRKTCEP